MENQTHLIKEDPVKKMKRRGNKIKYTKCESLNISLLDL